MPITLNEYTYPFDPTGTAPSNKVVGEVHVITQQNHRDFSFVIPDFAPFFAEGVVISFTDIEGNIVPLVEGQDFYLAHHFLAASRSIGKQVYGSISFITKNFKGTMSLSYQTLGGMWTYDKEYLIELMSNIISNPRISSWDSIVALPALFPVIDHEWNLIDMVGMSHIAAGLYGIEQAIRDPEGTGTGGGSGSDLMNHILDNQNPHHTTKLQVGLGNVDNYATATQAEAEAGVVDNRFMTPILVKRAITSLLGNIVQEHLVDTDNPHNVTASQVGLGNVQNYGIASQAEAEAGLSNLIYMTPIRVKDAITALALSELNTHTNDSNNPHSTTKTQVGLGNVDNFATATLSEAQDGTATNKFMTPSLVKEAINALVNAVNINAHLIDYNNPHRVTAALVGAYSTAEMDNLLSDKLNIDGTAANSVLFNNLTVQQLTTQILSNKIANAAESDTVGGKSYQDIIDLFTNSVASNSARLENKTLVEVLQEAAMQTSLNSTMLNNMTLDRLYEAIPTNADVAAQKTFNAVPVLVSGSNLYTELFAVLKNSPGDAQALIMGGGTSIINSDSYAYLVKINTRDSTLRIINLYGFDTTLEFSLVSDETNLHLWVKSPLERQQISVIELSREFAIWPDVTLRDYLGAQVASNVVVSEPIGWAAVTEINLFKSVVTHINQNNNPHNVTATQVGLGNVDDYVTADQAEAEAGTANNRFMTPLRTANAITAQVGNNLTQLMTELTTLFNGLTV